MFCYKALVNDLDSEIGKLNIENDKMSREVKNQENNGKIIEDYVLKWQNDVKEIQAESGEELSPSCSCIQRLPLPNPISRFQIGRNAAKKAQTVAKITATGNSYLTGEIAHLPEFINMPDSNTIFEEFQSRKDVYKKLWDVLVTEDGTLIHGIYGMAGVGKTRMMEKLWEDAMKQKIFKKVVRVNVGGEKLDKAKLQDQIAGRLDCKLQSQDVESRAFQLRNSLRNWGKILLVFDDVWTEIGLNNIIGASFGDGSTSSKGSKILFTSRKKEVCENNKCEHVVEIETLSPDEALYLFRKTVAPDSKNPLPDESLVKEVCDKCGQLPLVIHAVGKALKGKSHYLWKDAHNQLKKGKFEEIADVDPQVYAGIKLSIDYLQNDDAKSCLFLCSMFPEDDDIDMKILIHLATGSRLIPDGESRILAMVDYLRISSLLLDSGKDDEIKVHDIIRDVARSIASTDSKYGFLQVSCNSGYFPSNASDCTRKFLRLDVEIDDVHFKEHEVCPDLHTLWLQCKNHPQQFSGGFFSMFANLSYLMLQSVKISLEQFSLQPLRNLRTLTLSGCDIRKTDVSLFPKKLKTLWIRYCELPSPMDVANLKHLRKLEIQHSEPALIMRNVISSLSSLEELHIPDGLIIEHENKYHMEPIAMEISELTHLTSLHFSFYDDNTFQGTNIFSKINRYNIFVDAQEEFYRWRHYFQVSSMRSIEFCGNNWQPWEGLMARAEEMRLGYSDIDVISSMCNGDRRAFEDLKRLDIEDCNSMGHIASISQNEIQYSLQSAACFSKLSILEITECSKLKYLFCNNIAKSLGQLQKLSVKDCESMEAIIMNEGGTSDGDIIIFSKLKSLEIGDMFRLESFYVKKNSISTDNSANLSAQPLFDGMVAFPSLEKLDISVLRYSSVIWGEDCYNDTLSSFCKLTHLGVSNCDNLEIMIPQAMLHRLYNLESIYANECNSLRSMFPSSVATDLTHLKKISVMFCEKMREIIGVGEQEITDGILFPELTDLYLCSLTALTNFWRYQSRKADTCKVPFTLPQLSSVNLVCLPDLKSFFYGANFEFHMPALKNVMLDDCGLSAVFTFSMFTKFQLKSLNLNKCGLLENVVEDLRDDETCYKIITLFRLTRVELTNLPNLTSFFYNANYEFHMPVIKDVRVTECGLYNALFTRSIFKSLKQLEKLIVCDCELLEGVFEDARGDETLNTSDKIITLDRVSVVIFERLPKFKSIFYGTTYEWYMPALKDVIIVDCELSILFTGSVFREIRQLESLDVSECVSLEHIVEEVGVDETSEMNDKSITFSKLSFITLESLPNLKSFCCTSSYVFNMPKLQNFRLMECPQIEYFSSLKTNTSSVRVTSDWCSNKRFQELNDFIKQNHKRCQDLGSQSLKFDEEEEEEEENQEEETESDTYSSD